MQGPKPGELPAPHNLEAEVSLLGTILQDPACLSLAIEQIRPQDFYLPAHQKVMEAMLRLFEKGAPCDVVAVGDMLATMGDLEAVGGLSFLARLEAEAKPSATIEYYAKIIRDKALMRRMIEAAAGIVAEGYSSDLEPEEYLDWAEQKIFSIGEERIRGRVRRLDEVLRTAVTRIQALCERGEHVTGIPTRYESLDRLLLGLQDSDLIILAARPAMGKTSFALNLAINATCYSNPRHVLFCSLEMAEQQIANRIISIYKGLDSQRLRRGFLAKSELQAIREARDFLAHAPLYIDDSPRLSVLELRAKARRMRARGQLDMVIVDYLQLMEPTDKKVSREQQVSEISRSLKALAKELNIPVIALSQLSRAPETRAGKDKRPQLSDLRESGALEQDADVVLFLYRPEYYERENTKEEDRGVLEVIVAKQRNGPTGRVRLGFIEETMQVVNIAGAEVMDY